MVRRRRWADVSSVMQERADRRQAASGEPHLAARRRPGGRAEQHGDLRGQGEEERAAGESMGPPQ